MPRQPDPLGLLAVAGAGLLPVLFVDEMYLRAWAPKAALCLVLLPPGLVVLARLVAARVTPAVLAAAFVLSAAVSAVLSDNVALSVVGMANWGTGLVATATLAAAWALGARAGERSRRYLVLAILGAAFVNAVVAWLQVRSMVPTALEDVRSNVGGRAGGLLGNPIHLGAFMAGATWLLSEQLGRLRRSLWWAPALALVAGAAQLSGGRSAVALAGCAALVAVLRAPGLRRLIILGAVAVGVVLAPIGADDAVLGSSRALRQGARPPGQVSEAGVAGRTDTRLEVWKHGAEAVGEKPVFGWGPARFLAATSHRYNANSGQEGGVFADAHNWVVEYGVTTGVLGLALLLGWLGTAGRRARGPLAGFAAVMAVAGLVEPISPGLAPVAMLALGAAGPKSDARLRTAPVGGGSGASGWRIASAVAVVVGVAAGAVLATGQVFLRLGQAHLSADRLRTGAALSPPWPDLPILEARVEVIRGLERGDPDRPLVLALARDAVERDPADPVSWSYLGIVELTWGETERAADAYRRSLEREPWFAESLWGSIVAASRLGDDATVAASCEKLAVLGIEQPDCLAMAGLDTG